MKKVSSEEEKKNEVTQETIIDENDNKKKIRKIMIIIAIIIIILLLLTSCTSKYWGQLGKLFGSSSTHTVEKGHKKHTDTKLFFDSKEGSISLDEDVFKIPFSSKDILFKTFTCTTSDANIATCMAKDDYVEVYPKSDGNVKVNVQSKFNGDEYIGTYNLTIEKGTKGIELSKKETEVKLGKSKTIKIPYKLKSINGTINVISSDEKVAIGKAEKNVLTIDVLQSGEATITVKVVDNNKVYKDEFKIKVLESSTKTTTTTKMVTKPITTKKSTTKKTVKKTTKKVTTKKTTKKVTTKKTTKPAGTTKPTGTTNSSSATTTTNTTTSGTTSTSNTTTSSTTISTTVSSSSTTSSSTTSSSTTSSSTTSSSTTSSSTTSSSTEVLSDNFYLSNIEIKNGNNGNYIIPFTPTFNRETDYYEVTVDYSINNIEVVGTSEDSKATIFYNIGSEPIDNTDIDIGVGINNIYLTVKSDSGNTKLYTIKVTRKNSYNVVLDSLSIINNSSLVLSPTFDSQIMEYTINNVPFETSTIDIEASSTATNTIYSFKGNSVISLNSLELDEGANILQITLMNDIGEVSIYKITINRASRKIDFLNEVETINYEDGILNKNNTIGYTISEKTSTTSYQETDQFYITDILYSIERIDGQPTPFSGTINVSEKNILRVIPNNISDVGEYKLTIKYQSDDKTDELTLKITLNDYYITLNNNLESESYEIKQIADEGYKNAIFKTNIFDKDIEGLKIQKEVLSNGITLRNNRGSISFIVDDPSILDIDFNIEDNKNSNLSYALLMKTKNAGTAKISITGEIYGLPIAGKEINVTVKQKYKVTLDAANGDLTNCGYFGNSLTTKEPSIDLEFDENYVLKLDDIKDYVPKKDAANCKQYKFLYYTYNNEEIDDTTEIELISNIIIKAKFGDEIERPLTEEYTMYLDLSEEMPNGLFYNASTHNNLIYPGASGATNAHVMEIKNTEFASIKIKSFTIIEDTICFSETECLNMGYKLKGYIDSINTPSANPVDSIYYGGLCTGSSCNDLDVYKIVHSDNNVIISPKSLNYATSILPNTTVEKEINVEDKNLIIEKGKAIELSLLWKWLDKDDDVDTRIGKLANIGGDDYKLTFAITYEVTNEICPPSP